MQRNVPILLTALLLTAAPHAAAAQDTEGADGTSLRYSEDNEKLVLSNDEITVWFQGKKPMLKVFPAGNENASYAYKFSRLVEFTDANDNGGVDEAEVRAFINLEKAGQWEVMRTETAGVITLNLTTSAPITVRAPGQLDLPLPGDALVANLSLVFHIHAQPATLNASGTDVTVPMGAIKYDLVVDEWPWIDRDDGHLALMAHVDGGAVESDAGAAAEAAITAPDNTTLGYLAWLPHAEATRDGNTTRVPVNVHFAAIEAETNATSNATRMWFTFGGSGYDRLVYDPILGVTSAPVDGNGPGRDVVNAIKNAPGPHGVLLVGVGAACAWLARTSRSHRQTSR